MAIHQFGYSVESLQKDKIENLEKELESQTKLNNIKLNDMPSAFGMRSAFSVSDEIENTQEINFDDGETNAKSMQSYS